MTFLQYPWDTEPVAPRPAPAVAPADPDAPQPKAKRRGRRPSSITRAVTSAAAPDWLYHHLTISGPAEHLEQFATAARGSGVTPWQLDFAAIEEDVFVRAVPSLACSLVHLRVGGARSRLSA